MQTFEQDCRQPLDLFNGGIEREEEVFGRLGGKWGKVNWGKRA